jgi:hypothetical protein
MNRSIVTNYEQYSVFSGTPTTTHHHLCFGKGIRPLAEQDGIWIPVTDAEHNMSPKGTVYQIHDNPAAEKLSKIAGQLAYEKHWIAEHRALPFEDSKALEDEAREAFRKRYGKSFL